MSADFESGRPFELTGQDDIPVSWVGNVYQFPGFADLSFVYMGDTVALVDCYR